MITSLRLRDFKNFADETLCVGPFTVIVGANASGKSNIRDAFRFLHGIGRGYALAEIIGGKHGPGGQVEWEQVRGATSEITRFGKMGFGIELELEAADQKAVYEVEVSPEISGKSGFRITHERLRLGRETVYEKARGRHGDNTVVVGGGWKSEMALDQPALAQIGEDGRVPKSARERVEPVIDALSSMRFLDPEPDRMRLPAFPGQTVLGDRGENLPAVLKDICGDPTRRDLLMSWVRKLTPMDVEELEFPIDSHDGRVRFFIREAGGRRVSAHSASDGMLRFLTLLSAMLGAGPARLYFFETIDAGLHPARFWLLLKLLEEQTAKAGIQAITTSHSPDMLTLADDNTFEHMSVVCRLEDARDAIIRRAADLPDAAKLREDQGLGRLLSTGWMEDALAFTEGHGNDGKDSV